MQLAPVLAEMTRVGFDFIALVGGTSNAVRDIVSSRPNATPSASSEIRLTDLKALERELGAMTTTQRAEVPGLHPKRRRHHRAGDQRAAHGDRAFRQKACGVLPQHDP